MRIAILGRVDDMLIVKCVNVLPSAVRDVVLILSDKITGSVRIVKDREGEVAGVDYEQRTENPRVGGFHHPFSIRTKDHSAPTKFGIFISAGRLPLATVQHLVQVAFEQRLSTGSSEHPSVCVYQDKRHRDARA